MFYYIPIEIEKWRIKLRGEYQAYDLFYYVYKNVEIL